MFRLAVFVAAITLSTGARAAPSACEKLENEASVSAVHILGYQSGHTGVGKGRIQFYSAPSEECKMHGVFILPGQKVNAYTMYNGFTSVMYLNMKGGTDATGWVHSDRLKFNGTGMAPKQ